MSYKIGITGGIGAGKTTVAAIFSLLGVPIYNADHEAKRLMVNDLSTRNAIVKLLGEQAFLANKELNSSYIAEKVFNDSWLLNKLNGIVHPAVAHDYKQWHRQYSNHPYTLKEAALLYDAGSYLHLDAVIVVTAPEEARIARVIRRDHSSRPAILARINKQWPEARRLQLADFIVRNEGQSLLTPQVLSIHNQLLA